MTLAFEIPTIVKDGEVLNLHYPKMYSHRRAQRGWS